MTIITIESMHEDGGEAVMRTIDDRQDGETVSAYVGRVYRAMREAADSLMHVEGFGRDNSGNHHILLTSPELDEVGKAMGAIRATSCYRSLDPTTAKRIIIQGLHDGAGHVSGQFEKFLNGEIMPNLELKENTSEA